MSDPAEKLWDEYKHPFEQFDDLTLARWLAQTLGQFEGRVWRMSHPLVSAYRAAAELCGAPLLPLFTRDVLNTGLLCQHCGATTVEFDDIPALIRKKIEPWAEEYADYHAVAHYDEGQMRSAGNYDDAFEKAA